MRQTPRQFGLRREGTLNYLYFDRIECLKDARNKIQLKSILESVYYFLYKVIPFDCIFIYLKPPFF